MKNIFTLTLLIILTGCNTDLVNITENAFDETAVNHSVEIDFTANQKYESVRCADTVDMEENNDTWSGEIPGSFFPVVENSKRVECITLDEDGREGLITGSYVDVIPDIDPELHQIEPWTIDEDEIIERPIYGFVTGNNLTRGTVYTSNLHEFGFNLYNNRYGAHLRGQITKEVECTTDFEIWITATNSAGTDTITFTLTVNDTVKDEPADEDECP